MICIRTTRNWLEVFGFEYSEVRKRIYIDGHKRTDVVAYHERFLERMAEYETHMIVFSDKNMKEETQPAFQDIVILVIHDECIFSAYDRRCWLWIPKGEQPLHQVVNRAIPIFEARFPGAKALFAFDNTTGHCAYSKDTLVTKNMNLSPGSK
ncbi:34848_t:CDS:2 [Racocetra persica]|uniref:34848_t:CDS:1 n=1 Tax=Racocetra persica TaxID=160502 RepID=A0ACA9NLJ5_9GLOM|nr:34848_t:CDS:2 [Racocetra persica]